VTCFWQQGEGIHGENGIILLTDFHFAADRPQHIQGKLCNTVVVRGFLEDAPPGTPHAAISGRFPLPIKDYGHSDEKPDSGSKRYQT
jgi:hypothetical protein